MLHQLTEYCCWLSFIIIDVSTVMIVFCYFLMCDAKLVQYVIALSPFVCQSGVLSTAKHERSWWNSGRFILSANRHHRSSVDCLESKGENYQVCSVQYCVQQLCTVQCTHIWTDLTVLWIGFCLTGPISLCLDSCVYCVSLCGEGHTMSYRLGLILFNWWILCICIYAYCMHV